MADNKNDKGYRRILSDKRNFLDFVKNHIAAPWVDRIDADDLELIDGQFVTTDFKDRETDIIYRARVDGEDTIFYVLLEMQSKVDFTMPFRLLVYMTGLLGRLFADTEQKVRKRKGFRLPAVVPIVLYNGTRRWSCVRSFKEYLAGYDLFAPNIIDFEYIMIDINEPNEAELIKIPTLMNLAMFADRKGDPENVLHRLRTVIDIGKRLTRDEQTQLKDWITDVVLGKMRAKLGGNEADNIQRALERKDDGNMTYAIERAIDEVERRGKREGKAEGKLEGKIEGKLEAAEEMIKDGIPWETASKYSGIPVNELKEHIAPAIPQ
jgi:predicted transposase/invertase (TIGR01784 family)